MARRILSNKGDYDVGSGVSSDCIICGVIRARAMLGLIALILSVMNGLVLLVRFLRDRPILQVKSVYPEVYQWFFSLPSREYQGCPTRSYGFLVYIDVINRGRRSVQLESWKLRVPSKTGEWSELPPLSIPEPCLRIGEAGEKVWPVLGVPGPRTPGSTLVPSGESIGGFAYYVVHYWGASEYDLKTEDRKTSVVLEVRSILGNRAHTQVTLREKPIEEVQAMIPGIESVDRADSLHGERDQ